MMILHPKNKDYDLVMLALSCAKHQLGDGCPKCDKKCAACPFNINRYSDDELDKEYAVAQVRDIMERKYHMGFSDYGNIIVGLIVIIVLLTVGVCKVFGESGTLDISRAWTPLLQREVNCEMNGFRMQSSSIGRQPPIEKVRRAAEELNGVDCSLRFYEPISFGAYARISRNI